MVDAGDSKSPDLRVLRVRVPPWAWPFSEGTREIADRFLNAIFPVKLVDPIAFLLAVFSLVMAVTIAMLIPARRATTLHPALVLRDD